MNGIIIFSDQVHNLNRQIVGLANPDQDDAAANRGYVLSQVSSKADKSELTTKANKTDLIQKADKSEPVQKADITYVIQNSQKKQI